MREAQRTLCLFFMLRKANRLSAIFLPGQGLTLGDLGVHINCMKIMLFSPYAFGMMKNKYKA